MDDRAFAVLERTSSGVARKQSGYCEEVMQLSAVSVDICQDTDAGTRGKEYGDFMKFLCEARPHTCQGPKHCASRLSAAT